jgi:hypothetical protein
MWSYCNSKIVSFYDNVNDDQPDNKIFYESDDDQPINNIDLIKQIIIEKVKEKGVANIILDYKNEMEKKKQCKFVLFGYDQCKITTTENYCWKHQCWDL